jgi:hypothetical protein
MALPDVNPHQEVSAVFYRKLLYLLSGKTGDHQQTAELTGYSDADEYTMRLRNRTSPGLALEVLNSSDTATVRLKDAEAQFFTDLAVYAAVGDVTPGVLLDAGSGILPPTVANPTGSYLARGSYANTRCSVKFTAGVPSIVSGSSMGIASVTDNGVGDVTINFTTSYSSATAYQAFATAYDSSNRYKCHIISKGTTGVRIQVTASGADVPIDMSGASNEIQFCTIGIQ